MNTILKHACACAIAANDLLNIDYSLRNSDALLNADIQDILNAIVALDNAENDARMAGRLLREELQRRENNRHDMNAVNA